MMFALVPSSGRAQSSIVPATHSVYEWLQSQRVFGRLPTYDNEVRPMSRGTILTHLRTLTADSARFGSADRQLLRDYLNEFDFDRLLANGLWRPLRRDSVVSGLRDGVRSRRDPYLYAGRSADSTITGALSVEYGYGEMFRRGPGITKPFWGQMTTRGARAYVNTKSGFGAHAQVDMAWFVEERAILYFDPRLSVQPSFLSSPDLTPADYDAWLSYRRKGFEVHFGRGAASIGPAITDPLVVRYGAPSMSQLRVRVGGPKLNLMFLQGQLSGPQQTDTVLVDGVRTANLHPYERWVAMTRIAWSPSPRFTATVHQMSVYSGRGLDFGMLNPLLPVIWSGAENESPNNSFVGFDLVARPVRGTEVFTSLLVDDAKKYWIFPIGNDQSKIAVSAGLEQRLPGNVRLGVGITHLDAFAYSNFLHQNAWEVSGVPLGPALGSNAEEVAVRLTRWFPFRTRLMVGTRHVRQGLNPVDAAGKVTANVGGDINNGISVFWPFLQGADVQTYRHDEVEFESEPIRGLKVSARVSAMHALTGTRIPQQRSLFIRLRYGL